MNYDNRTPIYLLLLCLTFCLNNDAWAQTSENLHFEQFTIEEGLSSDRVNDVTQDQDGYIWIGTESGLNKYDGYDFAIYSNIPGNSTSLSDNFINIVHVDRRGEVWVGTNSGLNQYNKIEDSFERYYHDPQNQSSLAGNVIHEVFESENESLWIGTNNGLSMFDPQNQTFINNWKLKGGQQIDLRGIEITSIAEDTSGTLWIGSSNRGLITFNPEEKSIRYFDKDPIPGVSFPTRNIKKVFIDSFGKVWISFLTTDLLTVFTTSFTNNAGLGRLDPESGSFKLFKYDPETQPEFWEFISDITETHDSTLWVSSFYNTFSGIHRFDRTSEKFKTYTYDPFDPYSLTWNYVEALYEDHFNNLWVGTSRGLNKADLSKWVMNTFTVRPDAPYLLLDNFYGIEEVQENTFWLGLDGPGFIQWNRNTNETTHFGAENTYSKSGTEDITYGNIHHIKKDHNGDIWLGYGGNGVARVDPVSKETVRYVANLNDNNSLTGNFVTGILIDDNNTVWISTSRGLNRYNRESDNFTSWTTENSKLPSNSLSSIFLDSQGDLWLGTKKHQYDINSSGDYGLIKFDPISDAAVLYQHSRLDKNSLSNNAINSITEDLQGNLWIATNNGLNKFNERDESFQQYHIKDGLPDAVVIGMLIDNDGNLWLSTLKGLSRFDASTESFRNYGKDDGVQENRFNDYSYFKTDDGELIFGGVAGANYFFPSESFDAPKKTLINLTQVLVNNAPYKLTQTLKEINDIDLNWSENSVGFEFTAINFRSPKLTEYKYKLDGYDEDWISSGTRRYANYTNLSSGNYQFNVQAVNAEGFTSSDNASLSITIHPPFWNTWWAYIFYVLIFAGAIFGIDRIQRRRVLFQEKERAREKELKQARKIEDAYHELEASLEELKAAQDQLVQQEKLASLGQLTAGIAHEIKNPLNFVNNFSELSVELIDESREKLSLISDKLSADDRKRVDEAFEILTDIEINLKKIHEHGTRADSIVKSMLLHSRGTDGARVPTELNSLIKEYVNLSFHGMRAGSDPINVDINMEFDDSIGEVPLIAEDFSRVIINLCNNAFDAMRSKLSAGSSPSSAKYSPKLTVRTYMKDKNVYVEIEDNGPGIPEDMKDKIMQPFFTTKKGTQGTGLGLSITNDIIKAHGGKLSIVTNEGSKTTFSIALPLNSKTS